jgi:predicted 3-demethylubiquinone-9 3-methyltransferase (glyoxalase superfamily)
MQKITPNLWFDTQAEEAVKFYTSIFKNSKVGATSHYDEASAKASGQPVGGVLTIEFQLEGQDFLALNGGPIFKFNEAISFAVSCKDQAEVDYYWEKLSAVPESEQCGWLKDKFGLSWQIVPDRLAELLNDPDKAKASRAMNAMLSMKKLDIAELEKAAQG